MTGNAYINLPIALWVAPQKVLGGNVGFGVMVPYGWKDVDVDIDALATLDAANGTTIQAGRHFDFEDSFNQSRRSCPQCTDRLARRQLALERRRAAECPYRSMGHREHQQHRLSPLGTGYEQLSDLPRRQARTRDIGDGGVHVQWRESRHGLQDRHRVSCRDGIDAARVEDIAFGIAGYHYQQITGDSGAGAKLGAFEGRVTGLGPDVTYTFMCGKIPVSTELKYFREFDVENRLTGDAAFST